jgi:hypothetical protein
MRASIAASFVWSGYVGTWRIGHSRHESGVQTREGMVSGMTKVSSGALIP